ncbi:MAG: hypothetical protein DWQ07_20425 [Chloroflexi bacterium]|nr:MAG: hypothetical protein DWQ07_20425 [Chloroflexota bacterium]MBL1194449.1 hypothetical protein [Chloroflexota bacterium]NOH11737.1 hypothetical protein [Chloroflexota bacterium]
MNTTTVPYRSGEGPQAALELNFIELYLGTQGHTLQSLETLSEAEATRLMKAACGYAALKLAEIEGRAGLRRRIADIMSVG